MLAWLAFLALLVGEIFTLRWWLNREYYPVIFNLWAVTLYTVAFAVDASIVWLVSFPFEPGGDSSMLTLMIITLIFAVIFALFTFFFRWVARQDLS